MGLYAADDAADPAVCSERDPIEVPRDRCFVTDVGDCGGDFAAAAAAATAVNAEPTAG